MRHAPRRPLGLVIAPFALAPILLTTAALAAPAVRGQAQEAQVNATDALKFDPARISVPVGGTVTWTNAGATFHTVTGGEGQPDPASPVGNGTLPSAGSTYSATFPEAGTFPYFCQPHLSAGMTGVVVVGAAATATTRPTPQASATTEAPGPQESQAPGADESEVPKDSAEGEEHVPGIDDNETLERIESRRASDERAIGGFFALLWAAIGAMVVLGIALAASTRTRRTAR